MVAHDGRKDSLISWASKNKKILKNHNLFATSTTGTLLEKELGTKVTKFNSGPYGGDQQIGAKIATGDIDCLIFFYDPLASHPRESDIRALQRIAAVKNIVAIFNESTGDVLVTSPFLNKQCIECKKIIPIISRKVS